MTGFLIKLLWHEKALKSFLLVIGFMGTFENRSSWNGIKSCWFASFNGLGSGGFL